MNAPIASVSIPSGDEQDYFTLGELVAVLRRHRISTMLSGFGAAIFVFAFGVCRTPLFDAQATLTLDLNQRTVAFDQQSAVDQNAWSFAHELLRTQRNILLSRDLLQAALKTGGLSVNPSYAGNADSVDNLRGRFSVNDNRDSWDLTLTLRDEDPSRAESGLQGILDAYRSRYTDSEKARSEASIEFLESQLAEAKSKMEQSREAEQRFQESKELVVLDAERSQAAQLLAEINTRINALNQQITAMETLVAQIRTIDAAADPEQQLNAMLALEDVNRHPAVFEQQRLLFDLKTKGVELGQKYLDKHPRMIEIQSAITSKTEQLQQIVAMIRWGILSDRNKLSSQLIGLNNDKSKAEGEFSDYRLNVFKLQTLSQETKAYGQLYDVLLKRLGEERIAQHLDRQQLTETDSPTANGQPANIHITISVLAALVSGLIFGILTPLCLEILGRRANSKSEIQAMLGKPVIGELPYISYLEVFGAHGDPGRPPELAEAVRGLRARLRFRQAGGETGEILMIASCDPGDGKSTVAVRLAMSLAQSGRKVLLVDGNMRNPTLHIQLGQKCDRGLSRLLAGEPGISPAETTYSNLHFIDAGDELALPGELLSSHCLQEWLQLCSKQFDEIIIDTPALSKFADALLLGECSDRILLVVKEGATRKESLTYSNQLLLPLLGKLTGIAIIHRPKILNTEVFQRRMRPLSTTAPESAAPSPAPGAKRAAQ